MPHSDDRNTITTPTGETIVLAPGAPRSLESHFGLLLRELREAYEAWLAAAEEACRAASDQRDDGRAEAFNLTPIVDPDYLVDLFGGRAATGGAHDLPQGDLGVGF